MSIELLLHLMVMSINPEGMITPILYLIIKIKRAQIDAIQMIKPSENYTH